MRLEARKYLHDIQVDDRLVWDVLETKLPDLRREVDALLDGD